MERVKSYAKQLKHKLADSDICALWLFAYDYIMSFLDRHWEEFCKKWFIAFR